MKRRQLVVILISILVIILILAGILVKLSPKARYEREYSKLEDLYTEKLYQGYDLSEAEDIAKKAKEAYNKGDYETALRSLNEAIIALESAKKAAPVMLPSIWTEEEYMEFFIQDYVDPVIPPLTKEQMLLIINDENRKQKTLKKLDDFLKYCDKKRDESVKSGLSSKEKKRIFEAINTITNSINQLKRDIILGNVDITYADYNKLRSSVIQTAQLQQELMKKYLEPWYDKFIREYKQDEHHPMKFSVFSDAASYYWNPKTLSLEDIISEINLLSETGVDIIRIDVVYDHWMARDDEAINKIDVAVDQIRKHDKKVYLALYGVAGWMLEGDIHDTIGKGKVSFDTWRKMYLGTKDQPGMVETVVKRYDPDYVNLVGEGTWWMQQQINEIRPASDWLDVTLEAANIVKEMSPDTFVVVDTIVSTETIFDPPEKIDHLNFFIGLMNGKNIDAVGIDVFGGMQNFEFMDEMLPYWNKDKELWIGQTWNSVGGNYMDKCDDKYITAVVYYAQHNGLSGYNLFFGKNLHTNDFKKTPAFYTLKDVIKEVRINTKS